MGFVPLVLVLIALIISIQLGLSSERKRKEKRRLKALSMSDVDNMDGHFFESYVAELLKNQGYRTKVTQGSGDLGVDVVAESKGNKYAIQVKRQQKNVSRRAVADAVAGMKHYRCNATMVVTNAYFSSGAYTLAKTHNCRLVDRDELADWIQMFHDKNLNGQDMSNHKGPNDGAHSDPPFEAPDILYGQALAILEKTPSENTATDYELAFNKMMRAATLNHGPGQFGVGKMYAEGIGVASDMREAIAWWGKAAVNQVPEAAYSLYLAHKNGMGGMDKNEIMANIWLSNAATLGYPDAVDISRNSNCRCGSGKKYKHCCGRLR